MSENAQWEGTDQEHGASGLAGDVSEKYMQHLIISIRVQNIEQSGSEQYPFLSTFFT